MEPVENKEVMRYYTTHQNRQKRATLKGCLTSGFPDSNISEQQ